MWVNKMTINGKDFWERIGRLSELNGTTTSDLASWCDTSNDVIRQWKSKGRIPKVENVLSIAEHLNTDVSFLLKGYSSVSIPEMEFVRDNPLCRKIVRYLMEDERLLEVISAFIESSEKKQERKEG